MTLIWTSIIMLVDEENEVASEEEEKMNTFYTDYSKHEYEGWAILKVNANTVMEGYVIVSQVLEYKAGKVRVNPESIDKTIISSLGLAMSALRRKVKTASKPVDKKLTQTLNLLGITTIETTEQVMAAYRTQVKAAADGKGGYTCDMDALRLAKVYALQQIV